jgi:hypothetical protein
MSNLDTASLNAHSIQDEKTKRAIGPIEPQSNLVKLDRVWMSEPYLTLNQN